MALRINYNLAASVAQRSLGASQDIYARQAEKLATGLRINKAGDDAAGMAVSERLKNQVRGLNVAGRNAQDGVSLVQTAEGALAETHTILGRLRELAVQAANDTLNATDRANLQTEANQLVSEIDRIAASTQFNGRYLLNKNSNVSLHDGGDGLQFQIGANQTAASNQVTVTVAGVRSQDLGDVKVLNQVDTGITATGAQTLTVGGVTGVKYNAEVDTVFDLKDAINAATSSGITASIKNSKLRLEASTSGKTLTTDSATGTTGVIAQLLDVSGTATLIRDAADTTTLEDIGVSASGSLTLNLGDFTTVANNTRVVTVTYATSDTLAQLKARVSAAFTAAAGQSAAGTVTGSGYSSVAAAGGGSVATYANPSATAMTITYSSGAGTAVLATGGTAGGDAKFSSVTDSGTLLTKLNLTTSAAATITGTAFYQDKYRLDSNALTGITSISSGTGGILDIGTQTAASASIATVDSAINQVSTARAGLGALQSRLESASRSIAIASENAAAANSRIADADIAESMSALVRAQILQQAGISVLAQANQAPSLVLQLLK
jgi:flagellin